MKVKSMNRLRVNIFIPSFETAWLLVITYICLNERDEVVSMICPFMGTLCLQPDRHVCSMCAVSMHKDCWCVLFSWTVCPDIISGPSSMKYLIYIMHVLYIVEFINNISVKCHITGMACIMSENISVLLCRMAYTFPGFINSVVHMRNIIFDLH